MLVLDSRLQKIIQILSLKRIGLILKLLVVDLLYSNKQE